MADQDQMQKNPLGLTKGDQEQAFNLEDFWQHQLHRIKEIVESEQSPKEGGCGFDQ